MTFKDLNIIAPILKALEEEGYTHPTPIQQQAIPILLKGKDLLGCAQTGTGKTAAFAIPILQHLTLNEQPIKGQRKIKALVVTPTRELAIQIAESFTVYGKHTRIKNAVIFGGVKQGSQTHELSKGVDILIATPGRLLDLISQGFITLLNVEYFVLDEADQMLDMGFIHDVKRIIARLPRQRQSLFFSATMPKAIIDLSKEILGDYEKVTIQPEITTAEKVEQAVYFIGSRSKIRLLVHLLQTQLNSSTLVFTRTKHGANKVVKLLGNAGIIAEPIHGNKSQAARQRALSNFKDGSTKVLVATDIAARGIDIDELAFVVNYELPNIAETYVHRIGRTGRAGGSGLAVSFCDKEERPFLKDIEKLIQQQIPVVTNHPFVNVVEEDVVEEKDNRPPRHRSSNNRPAQKSSNAAPTTNPQRKKKKWFPKGGGNKKPM
jgi:ATP-dependent RNA helicase RhlE